MTAETQTKTVEVSSSGFSRALSADPEASRAVYLKLRDWLASTGKPLPDAADGPVDREMLLLLSKRIREAQPVEWAEGKAPSRRWPWGRR